MSTDQRFRKEYRLRQSSDYDRVFQSRRSVSDTSIIVYGCTNKLSYSRVGLSVSRKVGGAVVRNRWKRLIREAFRLTRDQLPVSLDVVVIPRRGTVASLTALSQSLPKLAKQLQRRLHRSGRGDSK